MTDERLDPLTARKLLLTRRRFFGVGAATMSGLLGRTSIGSLLANSALADGRLDATRLATGPHFAPRAKRVIYLHMEGGPSHLDLFDYKPGLRTRFDQDLPESIRNGQRLTTMTSGQDRFPVAPSMFRFSRYPNRQDGAWVSEVMPRTGGMARELCIVRSMHTDAINHEPAISFFQTGSQLPGRPSFGSWMSYGLGSSNENLPSFVVLISQGYGNMQALSERFWGNGFLDGRHQGCKIRSGANPVLYLNDPAGISRAGRRRMLDAVAELNEQEAARTLDPEVATRIAQYEMAYRMQMSVPELVDFSDEDDATLAMYGPEVEKAGSFAANCLLARRLAERGVRFVQLFMRGWDAHANLPQELKAQSNAVDQPQAALLRDLAQRGLLDDTIVLWSGEFGRTVYSQGTLTETNYGRDHHPRAFSLWLAGGGFAPGIVHGATDDFGYNITRDPVSVHDLHATMLHQLGFDHERLVFRSQGRDFRLTDVSGSVVRSLLA